MDELASLENKIKSLKTIFASPEPLEKSWSQHEDSSSMSISRDDYTLNEQNKYSGIMIPNKQSPASSLSVLTHINNLELRLKNNDINKTPSPLNTSPSILPSNTKHNISNEATIMINRVEHQATIIREKMKIIRSLNEKIESIKEDFLKKLKLTEADHERELTAMVSMLDESRADLATQREITQKERNKTRQWERKYTSLHENISSLHNSVKEAYEEVEAEKQSYLSQLNQTKSLLIEAQKKLNYYEEQFATINLQKGDTDDLKIELQDIKNKLIQKDQKVKSMEHELVIWKSRAERSEEIISSNLHDYKKSQNTDKINDLVNNDIEKNAMGSAIRLVYEKRLAMFSYENAQLKLKLNKE